MSDRASHSEEDRQAGLGGIFVEYPTREEVDHCIRDLPFEQRLTVLSQGFHRGAAPLHCYNLKEFVEAVSKREFNNPAGGVRSLDFDLVVPWLRDVIGDEGACPCRAGHRKGRTEHGRSGRQDEADGVRPRQPVQRSAERRGRIETWGGETGCST